MPTPEYYRSEQFIWDNLKVQAASGIPSIYASWKLAGRIKSFALAWPAETVLDDSGVPIQGTCLIELSADHGGLKTLLHFMRKTKAYALLLTEQQEKEVLVILESHHGTRSWSIPILVSGDIRTLGQVVVKDDTHKIGLLWARQSSPS
jgi:hypothetical protein